MHKQILSDLERSLIEKFLDSNEKGKGFRMLKLRILKYHERLNQDFTLLKKAYEKFSN
jgi:hypothetical protein